MAESSWSQGGRWGERQWEAERGGQVRARHKGDKVDGE
jgi:hypothetical protein